ncbi:MAG: hypothetical protein J6Y20_07290 [Lachnospiraceae bacterium]|nr:hypothetical protein [Lachnospiraceae bacterium]
MNTNIASKKLLRSSEAAVIAKLQGPQIRALMEEHGIEVNGRRYILRERVRELIRAGETAKYRSISIWDTAVRLGRQRWKGAKKR